MALALGIYCRFPDFFFSQSFPDIATPEIRSSRSLFNKGLKTSLLPPCGRRKKA